LQYWQSTRTRNSPVGLDEIGERYRLNNAIVVKLYHSYTWFPRNVRRIATFSANSDTCDYCAL